MHPARAREAGRSWKNYYATSLVTIEVSERFQAVDNEALGSGFGVQAERID